MKRAALAGTLAALTAVLFAQAPGRSLNDVPGRTAAESQRAADRLQALQQEAERLAAQERTLLGDLRRLEIDREIKIEELRDASAKADEAERALARVNEQVATLEREDLSQRPDLSARLVELYKLGQGRYLRLLLSASNAQSVARATRAAVALAAQDRERVDAHRRTLERLETTRGALEAQARTLASARAGAEKARSEADRAVANRNALIADIDAQRDLNAQLSGELLAAREKLQSTIRQLGAAPVEAPMLPLRPFRGDIDWPVAGAIRVRFGRAGARGAASSGIEIAADEGTAVRAVHEGTVAFAGPFAGFGNLVIVQHEPDVYTLYGNLGDLRVIRGARLQRGETLGSVGTAPAGPPELYFELRVGGQPVDPVQWLKKR